MDFAVYKGYLHFNGGCKQIFWTHLALILFTVSKVASDFVVGSWAIAPD